MLNAPELRQLLGRCWTPPGVRLDGMDAMDPDVVAAIVRITGGNLRLLDRLLTQMERVLEINALGQVTRAVVESAREGLVIGQA